MKRCKHPASARQWNEQNGVYVCQKCGQLIFPGTLPEDDFSEQDERLCWKCGGTGLVENTECAVCQGEGYVGGAAEG